MVFLGTVIYVVLGNHPIQWSRNEDVLKSLIALFKKLIIKWRKCAVKLRLPTDICAWKEEAEQEHMR